MRLLLAILFMTSSGCGGNVADVPQPPGVLAPGAVATSSPRLRLRVLESSTGVQVPFGFHDTTLDVDCQPGSDARGVMRCLPDAPATVQYADASCATLAVPVPASCPPPRYVSRRVSECLYAPRTFHEVGGRVEAVHEKSGGVCVPSGPKSGDVHYGASGSDHTERFAAFTEQRRSLGSRFDRRVFVSDDGAEWSTGALFDRELARECRPAAAIDGKLRCVPGPFRSRGILFGDPSCSKPIVTNDACAPMSDVFVFPSCAGLRSYRVVGPFDGVAYSGRESACSASTAAGPFAAVEELSPETFGALGSELGAAGLEARIVDGTRIIEGIESLRDAATGEHCDLRRDAAGNFRCVPQTPVMFADPDCTKPVVQVFPYACSAAPSKRAMLLGYHAADPCTDSLRVLDIYEVGAELKLPGAVLYTRSDAKLCIGTSDTKNSRVFEAKSLGLDTAPAWRVVTL